MMTRADDERREGEAASPRGVRAREQAAARLLPRPADISVDQRRAGARPRCEGAGGAASTRWCRSPRGSGHDRLPIGGGASAAARGESARRPRARAAARGGGAGRDDRRARRAGRARDSRGRRGAGVQGLQGISRDDLRVGERAGGARDPVAEDGAERGRHHLDRPRREDGRLLRRLGGDGRRRPDRRRRRPTCCA